MMTPSPITDTEMATLFREWWAESYPTPPGTHAQMTHLGWGRRLLELAEQRQQYGQQR